MRGNARKTARQAGAFARAARVGTGAVSAWILCAAMVATVVVRVGEAAGRDLSGRWRLEFQPAGGQAPWQADCVLEQERERLSGGCTSGFDAMATVRGTAANGRVRFTLEPKVKGEATPESVREFRGRLNRQGSRITGTWTESAGEPLSSPSSPSSPSRPVPPKGPFTAVRR